VPTPDSARAPEPNRKTPPDTLRPPRPEPVKDDGAQEAGTPAQIRDKQEMNDSTSRDSTVAKRRQIGKKQKIATCKELDVTPNFEGNMTEFTQKIEFPKKYQAMQVSYDVDFSILFDTKGKVEKADPARQGTKPGFQEAIQKAIEKHITIKPVVQQGDTLKVRCDITIPNVPNND
jgi:hypothetical protein